MLYLDDSRPGPRWFTFDFTSKAASVSVETIRVLAANYDEDNGDSVNEYIARLGVNKDDQRLVKAEIRRLRKK